jgi:hypothetical protein
LDTRSRELVRIGNKLFGDKREVDSLWQEIAYNFYPERADFTDERSWGDEFSDHLFSSIPSLARRELGNLMSANLRPQSQRWFSVHVDDIDLNDADQERRFLEHVTEIQWRAMYEPRANLIRATKETDHDYVAFGNGVIYVTLNTDGNGLLYRNYHLRDCAWSDNEEGKVDSMYRKWNPTARQLEKTFPDTISQEVKKASTKDPEKVFKCMHIVVPSRIYKNDKKFPYTSLYIEVDTEKILEEVGLNLFPYVVPRWMTVSGSPYGRSMATSIALPDGRTMQVIVRTLREAGEKYVDPPMIAIADAIRGDIPLYPGGITVADIDYDERLGEVLRPVSQDRGGFPIGMEVAGALREDIKHAFFLDKIQLPQTNHEMTAFEVRRRVEEHIRAVSPLFEPIESEYNAPLCELTFQMLMENKVFPVDQMPDSLSGRNVRFTFQSPLAALAEQGEAATFVDVVQRILLPVAQVDPAQVENVDMTKALREAMRSAGWKADWFKPIEEVEAMRQQVQQAQQMMAELQGGQQVAQIAATGGQAAQSFNEAAKEE